MKKSLFVLLPPWVGFSVGSGLVCPVKKYDLWAPPPYSVLPSTHSFPSYCAQIDMIVTNCDSAIVMATVTKLIRFQTLCSIVCAFSGDQLQLSVQTKTSIFICVASISPKISNNPQCLVQQRLKLKARNHLKQCAHLDIVLFFKVFPKDSRFYFFASGLCFFSSWRDVFPWHVFA